MDTLGNDRGYFGAKVFNYKEQMNKANWYHMGYPSDLGNFLQPYRQGQISVLDFTPPPRGRCTIIHGALTTDADMSVGQIGGPLWLGPEWDPDGNRYVTAVASRVESSYSVFSAGVLSRGDIGKLSHLPYILSQDRLHLQSSPSTMHLTFLFHVRVALNIHYSELCVCGQRVHLLVCG